MKTKVENQNPDRVARQKVETPAKPMPLSADDLHWFNEGTHLYEHADMRQGFQPDWNRCIYNYGRPEVRSFLISNAVFWLDQYHADGLRVDAVASMLPGLLAQGGRVDSQ